MLVIEALSDHTPLSLYTFITRIIECPSLCIHHLIETIILYTIINLRLILNDLNPVMIPHDPYS